MVVRCTCTDINRGFTFEAICNVFVMITIRKSRLKYVNIKVHFVYFLKRFNVIIRVKMEVVRLKRVPPIIFCDQCW